MNSCLKDVTLISRYPWAMEVCLLVSGITDELKKSTFAERVSLERKTNDAEGFSKIQALLVDGRKTADCSLPSSRGNLEETETILVTILVVQNLGEYNEEHFNSVLAPGKLLITKLLSMADTARLLWFPTDKPSTRVLGTVIKERVINEVISYSSWECDTSVKSTELLIFIHSAGVMSDFILVATRPAGPNHGEVRMAAEEASKIASEDLRLGVNDPSPKPSNDMLDINVAMLEVAKFPWLRKSVFSRSSEDKERGGC